MKMSQAIGVLNYAKRFVNKITTKKMYLSIIEPNLSYCCSMLECCSDTKLSTLKKLQSRAGRIFMSIPFDSKDAPLLQRIGSLRVDRLFHRETSSMIYKSLHGIAPENLYQVFSQLSNTNNRFLRISI